MQSSFSSFYSQNFFFGDAGVDVGTRSSSGPKKDCQSDVLVNTRLAVKGRRQSIYIVDTNSRPRQIDVSDQDARRASVCFEICQSVCRSRDVARLIASRRRQRRVNGRNCADCKVVFKQPAAGDVSCWRGDDDGVMRQMTLTVVVTPPAAAKLTTSSSLTAANHNDFSHYMPWDNDAQSKHILAVGTLVLTTVVVW